MNNLLDYWRHLPTLNLPWVTHKHATLLNLEILTQTFTLTKKLIFSLFSPGFRILGSGRIVLGTMLRSKILSTEGTSYLGPPGEKRGRIGGFSTRTSRKAPKDTLGLIWKATHITWSKGEKWTTYNFDTFLVKLIFENIYVKTPPFCLLCLCFEEKCFHGKWWFVVSHW